MGNLLFKQSTCKISFNSKLLVFLHINWNIDTQTSKWFIPFYVCEKLNIITGSFVSANINLILDVNSLFRCFFDSHINLVANRDLCDVCVCVLVFVLEANCSVGVQNISTID